MAVPKRAMGFLSVLTVVALGGCGTGLDRDQARVCRLVAVALADEGDGVAVEEQGRVSRDPDSAASDEATVRIGERVTGADGRVRRGFVECSFGRGPEREVLTEVRTEAGPLSLPRVFALNRFWLTSPEAVNSDPLPIAGADRVPRLPSPLGYVLQQIVNTIPSAAVYGLLAVAYSLVYGLIGRINLAFGAFGAIGGTAVLIAVLGTAGYPVALTLGIAALAALVPAACYGLTAARLVFRPLHGATGQQGLVATIGLALVLGEYLRLTQGADPRWLGPILDTPVAIARDAGFVVTLTPIAALVSAVAIATSAALLLAMRYSGYGRQWRAYRDDPLAAALFGVGRDGLVGSTFALASALAGLAGGITVIFFGDISFAYAQTIGLKALAAAILGGIGSVPGALLGGVFIALVESSWSAAFPIADRDLVVFCILVAALMWRPGGFLGDRDLTPRRI